MLLVKCLGGYSSKEKRNETRKEVTLVIQVRDNGGTDQGGGNGCSNKWLNYGCICQIELISWW